MTQTLFENFLDYCIEDNEQLSNDIKTWLADYFDLHNRTIRINDEEIEWIGKNLTDDMQQEIFGYTLSHYLLHIDHLKRKK